MIDLSLDRAALRHGIARARERGVVIPTLAQQADPSLVPLEVRERLGRVDLWAVDPVNLFRISWHNEPQQTGGGYGDGNAVEFPLELTGCPARILALVGKWFPTGAHKVGAAFGCLVPRLVSGQFDPAQHRAVWPSTGNFCRGGAYDAALLGCESVAVLPEGMSRERFDWLATIAGTVIKTPGSESNVKEIFDECWRLRRTSDQFKIFNQFDELGNYLWHYSVTGAAMLRVLEHRLGAAGRYRGLVLATGSAGTLASGDRLKTQFPTSKVVAAEAIQCPTLLQNGYGSHRIEGIGDKHVPWIHNVRNTDAIIGVDDGAALRLLRLFNERAGTRYLTSRGVSPAILDALPLVGISGAANLLASIKFAKSYDLGPDDVVLTVLTDSVALYHSRLSDMRRSTGELTETDAAAIYHADLLGVATDHVRQLTEADRRRVHNLKYFTWVEQQHKSVDELDAQWHDEHYWTAIADQSQELDAMIDEFNGQTGLLANAAS